jgi:ABC-type uncharacterized transport system permease subunit
MPFSPLGPILLLMKDLGEAITATVLLGLGLSAIVRGLVASGGEFGTVACQNSSPADCTLSLFLIVWTVVAVFVGSVYLTLRIRRGTRPRTPA